MIEHHQMFSAFMGFIGSSVRTELGSQATAATAKMMVESVRQLQIRFVVFICQPFVLFDWLVGWFLQQSFCPLFLLLPRPAQNPQVSREFFCGIFRCAG